MAENLILLVFFFGGVVGMHEVGVRLPVGPQNPL